MTYFLAPGISFALLGLDVVVMDLAADRYFRMGGGRASALRALGEVGNEADPKNVEALLAAGVLTSGDGSSIEPVSAPQPSVSILERPSTWGAERKRVDSCRAAPGAIAARIDAGCALKLMGLARTVSRWRNYRILRMPLARDEAKATRIARGYAARRRWLPLKRRCVPDSLALARCLWRQGVDADVYFGVRLNPFAAHAWVQADTVVLSDPLDSVVEFVPVFRL